MKIWLIVALLGLGPSVMAKSKKHSHKVHYPVILNVQGHASLVDDVITIVKHEAQHSEKARPLKKGRVLKDKALIRVDSKGLVRIALNASSTLILQENTEVVLPEISWTEGGVKEIHLLEGQIRYICKSDCDRKLNSAIYSGTPPAGDYILNYDSKKARMEMSVLSGESSFRGLENEESVVLHAGERASFQGVVDEDSGEPVFDSLLHGRKIAKGQLSKVQKIPADEMAELLKQEETIQKMAKAKPKAKRLPSQICDKPWGELNQCAWICEKNKKNAKGCLVDQGAVCVRMRCNANGEWSDRQEIPASQSTCKAQSFVGTCDY